jgi:hypothetical protein
MDSLFPSSYESSRARFLLDVERVRPLWPASRIESHPLASHPGLSLDWLWAEPRNKENLVVISTAEHGIEGYVGSAMLKLFMDEFAPRLNPETTGLLLIHAVNPWGMDKRYRVNPNNVDLNRNFVFEGEFSPKINPDYDQIGRLLNPQRPVRTLGQERIAFFFQIARNLIRPGRAVVQAASLLGQYRHPRGVYFGGTEFQEETLVLMGLYRAALAEYRNFIQVDMHTGYGPRYQMTFIIPPVDPLTSREAVQKFDYPLIQKIDAQEFYAISGDMGEYVYRLREAEFPQRNVFASGFEFGTFGDSLIALIRSLHITILENQLRQYGAASPRAEAQVRREYGELFFPSEAKWREKAIADCRQALKGVLTAYGLLGAKP